MQQDKCEIDVHGVEGRAVMGGVGSGRVRCRQGGWTEGTSWHVIEMTMFTIMVLVKAMMIVERKNGKGETTNSTDCRVSRLSSLS